MLTKLVSEMIDELPVNGQNYEFEMRRDHLLSSAQPLNNTCYMTSQQINYAPFDLEPGSPEFPELQNIPSQDLLLSNYAENSQCIEELCAQEKKDIKAKHNVLPDLDEHDKGGFNFEINLQYTKSTKWLYSKPLNRIYIKTNDIIPVMAVLKPRTTSEVFKVRIMMVYNSEVSEPVVRCENHSSKDLANEKNIKHSVLRCENSDVSYEGSVEGKNISDRLSILVPLGCVKPNDDGLVKQTIALKFVCQNSCVGRRETSIIYHLEDDNGEILAKKKTAIKICSCPKRDMKKDKAAIPKKRSANDNCPVGKKIFKIEEGGEIKKEVKQESEFEDDSCTVPSPTDSNDFNVAPNGVKLTLILPDVESAKHVVECAFNKLAGQIALNPDNTAEHSKMRAMKKLLTKLQRIAHDPK